MKFTELKQQCSRKVILFEYKSRLSIQNMKINSLLYTINWLTKKHFSLFYTLIFLFLFHTSHLQYNKLKWIDTLTRPIQLYSCIGCILVSPPITPVLCRELQTLRPPVSDIRFLYVSWRSSAAILTCFRCIELTLYNVSNDEPTNNDSSSSSFVWSELYIFCSFPIVCANKRK